MTQMWNERSLNIALWLELLVVSVVLWWVVDCLYVTLRTYYEPLGYDIAHTYQLKLARIPETSPNYVPNASKADGFREKKRRFVNYLEKHPEIEAVGMSDKRGIHYSGGSEWIFLRQQSGQLKEGMKYIVTPGYLEVFRIHGARGESPKEMGALLTDRTFLVGGNFFGRADALELFNRVNESWLINSFQDSVQLRLAGVLNPVRQNEFCSADGGPGLFVWFPEEEAMARSELFLRVKEGYDRNFIYRIKHEFEKYLGEQNLMISDFLPVFLLRENRLRDSLNELRNYWVIMGFLLVHVFLGLLGTFWFRTQQRYSEIALHIAVGSTRKQICMRIGTEGLFLLLFATLPALLLDCWAVYAEMPVQLGGSTYTVSRFVVTTGITCLLMAGIILAGIGIPVYRVRRMCPVEALRNE